jgi:hypothetical protein
MEHGSDKAAYIVNDVLKELHKTSKLTAKIASARPRSSTSNSTLAWDEI